MEFIQNNGQLVICPECKRRNSFKESVTPWQMFLCHNCRTRIQIRRVYGKLKPVAVQNIYESSRDPKKKRVRGTRTE